MGEELRELLPAFLSRYAVRAFTRATEMQLTRAGRNLKPKQLMHVVRLRLVGLHLLRTGRYEIAADRSLLAKFLGEHRALASVDARPAPERLEIDLAHWREELRQPRETSDLPVEPPAFDEVHDFVVALRLS